MKTLLTFLFLGIFSLSSYSINPVDPPLKTTDSTPAISLTSPTTNDNNNELCNVVSVTVHITVKDCPNYTCSFPANCTFDICFYDYQQNPLGCVLFNLNTCTYTFDTQGEEGTKIQAKFVLKTGNCTDFNQNIFYSDQIPFGGGDVNLGMKFCP